MSEQNNQSKGSKIGSFILSTIIGGLCGFLLGQYLPFHTFRHQANVNLSSARHNVVIDAFKGFKQDNSPEIVTKLIDELIAIENARYLVRIRQLEKDINPPEISKETSDPTESKATNLQSLKHLRALRLYDQVREAFMDSVKTEKEQPAVPNENLFKTIDDKQFDYCFDLLSAAGSYLGIYENNYQLIQYLKCGIKQRKGKDAEVTELWKYLEKYWNMKIWKDYSAEPIWGPNERSINVEDYLDKEYRDKGDIDRYHPVSKDKLKELKIK